MKSIIAVILLSVISFGFLATTAGAAERTRAGQWETRLSVGQGQPSITKSCLTSTEADFINGDLATLRKHLEQSTKEQTKGRCTTKNVQLNANQLIVTTACGKTEMVATTTYHGDSYETSGSGGVTIAGKLLGDCP